MNELLNRYYSARKAHDDIAEELDTEVGRIVNVIQRTFKLKNSWWAYEYYNADDGLPLPQPLVDDCFSVYIEGNADSGTWNYNDGFPVKFFDMTNDEIRRHIQLEIDSYKASERLRKEAQIRSKKQKVMEVENIKKKLTKKELKLLGIK